MFSLKWDAWKKYSFHCRKHILKQKTCKTYSKSGDTQQRSLRNYIVHQAQFFPIKNQYTASPWISGIWISGSLQYQDFFNGHYRVKVSLITGKNSITVIFPSRYSRLSVVNLKIQLLGFSRKNHGNRIFPGNQGNFYSVTIVTIKKIPVLQGSRYSNFQIFKDLLL